jgi:hypothetical protein
VAATDSPTVICRNKEPMDVPVRIGGKLRTTSGCKVYKKLSPLQTYSLIKDKYSSVNNDFMS